MFRPSQAMMARMRLTTKQVNGGYYKGNRTGSMGYFDKKGNYVIDWKKVRTYVVPDDLENCKLTPFVSNRIEAPKSMYQKTIEHNGRQHTVDTNMTGEDFLKDWEFANPNEAMEFTRNYMSASNAGHEEATEGKQ